MRVAGPRLATLRDVSPLTVRCERFLFFSAAAPFGGEPVIDVTDRFCAAVAAALGIDNADRMVTDVTLRLGRYPEIVVTRRLDDETMLRVAALLEDR